MPAAADQHQGDQEPKKKRRQNVACDSCKLRRIKCDLLTLLSPEDAAGSSSGSTSPPPPLHVLVSRNPDVMCTNCINKGLKCTTKQITNPVKPNKGGKRIEEARKMFGSDGALGRRPSDEDSLQHSDMDVSMEQLEEIDEAAPFQPFINIEEPTGLTPFLQPEFLANLSQDINIDNNNQVPMPNPSEANPAWPWQDPATILAQAAPFGMPGNTTAAAPTPAMSDWNPSGLPFQAPLPQSQLAAHMIWSEVANPPQPQQQQRLPLHKEPFMMKTIGRQHHTPGSPQSEMVFDALKDKFVPRNKPKNDRLRPQFDHSGFTQSSTPSSGPSGTPMTMVLGHKPSNSPPMALDNQALSRKRQRSDSEEPIEILREEQDPYGLWADDDKLAVRWTRRDEVTQRLADRALGYELSRHLVKVYFQAVHLSLPAISPESFYMEWQRSGERSDRMPPAQEVLCVVIEAWAARYSDNPVVLGLDESKAMTAPKVIAEGGRFIPGTQARAHWGRARLDVCTALVERARRLIDYHGILRKPSVTGVQALTLFSQLQHLADSKHDATEHVMETRMFHSVIIEQMRELELMWDSVGTIPVERGELPISVGQLRMKQRRLFWTMIVSDAFWAAGSGQQPKISDEDVESSGAWLLTVEEKLPPSTFKTLAFFMSCYHRLAVIGRTIARKLTIPGRRPGAVDVTEYSNRCRSIWRDIKDVYRSVSNDLEELLSACDHDLLGFSPLSYIMNLRQSCPFLLLLVHQSITEQLEFRKNLSAAFISDDSRGNGQSPETANLTMLESLEKQSIDGILAMGRSSTHMIKALKPIGIIQAGSVFMRVLIATTQFLAEIPTNEQGYPSYTPGGNGWTWETKQAEVGHCTDALYQLGWAWADISDVLDAVMVTMERMQPTPEALEEWTKSSANRARNTVDHVANQRQKEIDTDGRVLKAALAFWPPTSVPELVEQWKHGSPPVSGLSQLEGGFEKPAQPEDQPPPAKHMSWDGFQRALDDIPGQWPNNAEQPGLSVFGAAKQSAHLDVALDAITGPNNELHSELGERVPAGGREIAGMPRFKHLPNDAAGMSEVPKPRPAATVVPESQTLASGYFPGYDAVTDWTKAFVNSDTPDSTGSTTIATNGNASNTAPGSSHSSPPNPNPQPNFANLATAGNGLTDMFPTNVPPIQGATISDAASFDFENLVNPTDGTDEANGRNPSADELLAQLNMPGSQIDPSNLLNAFEVLDHISAGSGGIQSGNPAQAGPPDPTMRTVSPGAPTPLGARTPFNPSLFWQMDVPGRQQIATGGVVSPLAQMQNRDPGVALAELESFIQTLNRGGGVGGAEIQGIVGPGPAGPDGPKGPNGRPLY